MGPIGYRDTQLSQRQFCIFTWHCCFYSYYLRRKLNVKDAMMLKRGISRRKLNVKDAMMLKRGISRRKLNVKDAMMLKRGISSAHIHTHTHPSARQQQRRKNDPQVNPGWRLGRGTVVAWLMEHVEPMSFLGAFLGNVLPRLLGETLCPPWVFVGFACGRRGTLLPPFALPPPQRKGLN
ncbi:hypothetical protein VTK26DRAFT_2344 [Humicola hyalothermophila]